MMRKSLALLVAVATLACMLPKFFLAFALFLGSVLASPSSESFCSVDDPSFQLADQHFISGNYLAAYDLYFILFEKLNQVPNSSEDYRIICSQHRIAQSLSRMGRPEEGVSWLKEAMDRASRSEQSRDTAVLANNLALLYLELDNSDSAEQWARNSMEIAARVSGQDHQDFYFALITLGCIYANRGDLARAEPLLRQSLAHLGRLRGHADPVLAIASVNLAQLYRLQERYSEAANYYRKAIQALDAIRQSSTWEAWEARAALMVVLAHKGRHSESVELASMLDGVVSRQAGTSRAAGLYHELALARFLRKEYTSARKDVECALSLLESAYGPHSPRLLSALHTYAQISRASKDKQMLRYTDSRIKSLTQSMARP